MIFYVTGTMGAGKSYYACRKIAEAFLKGKAVATNIHLVKGWEKIVLKHAPYYRFADPEKKSKYEKEIRTRYVYIPEISELVHAKLHGIGQGRGIRVIDEAHNEINNREWAESNQKEILQIMTLSRKRGWDDYILSQHKDNTDAALRRVAGVEIKLLDWQQVTRIPFFQTPLLPFHLFLGIALPLNISGLAKSGSKPLWKELFLLGWQAKMYDTFEDFSGVDPWEDNYHEHARITLPVPHDFEWGAYEACKTLDIFFWGYQRDKKIAAAEAAAISAGIVAEISSRSPSRAARQPLPQPSSESRTPTSRSSPATSENGA